MNQKREKLINFVKTNKWVFFQMGLMLALPAIGFANDAQNIEISPLQTPMTKLVHFVSGPLSGSATILGLGLGVASHQLGWEQSITRKCGGCALAGACGTQLDSLCSSLGIIASSCNIF